MHCISWRGGRDDSQYLKDLGWGRGKGGGKAKRREWCLTEPEVNR